MSVESNEKLLSEFNTRWVKKMEPVLDEIRKTYANNPNQHCSILKCIIGMAVGEMLGICESNDKKYKGMLLTDFAQKLFDTILISWRRHDKRQEIVSGLMPKDVKPPA
jgi:hypothetical protein